MPTDSDLSRWFGKNSDKRDTDFARRDEASGGLEPGTEPGQALVWNGTEWVKQSGYGWNAEAQVTLEYDGVIGEKYYIGEEGMPKFVKLSDITNVKEMEGLAVSGPGATIDLPKSDLTVIAFEGGSGFLIKSTMANAYMAAVLYRTGSHYLNGEAMLTTEQTGFFVIHMPDVVGDQFVSKAIFDVDAGSKINGALLSHSYLHNIYAENTSASYILLINLITDNPTPIKSYAAFFDALGEAADPSVYTDDPLDYFAHIRPVSGGPFNVEEHPGVEKIPYGVLKMVGESGDVVVIVDATGETPSIDNTWGFSDVVSEIK